MEALKNISDFFQSEILGMSWLNRLIGSALSAIGLDINGKLGGSVHFFIYDMIKILILLCVLISLIPMARTIASFGGAASALFGRQGAITQLMNKNASNE